MSPPSKPADDEDRRLVARIVAGNDTAAFGKLVSRHQSQVRNFLRRLTRDPELAEDLAQDTFMHAWDRLHGYAGKGTVIGWLLKVAYTTFLQSRRRSRRYAEILEQIGTESPEAARQVATDNVEITDLDRFLAVLGEEERAVMILSYACGLSHSEIASATSQPVGTIKSIIFRGKAKIRQNFDLDRYQHG